MSEISKSSSSLSFRGYKAQLACLVSAPHPHPDGLQLSPSLPHSLPLHASPQPHATELGVGWGWRAEGLRSRTHLVVARLLLSLRNPGGWLLPQRGAALELGLLPNATLGPSSGGHPVSALPLLVQLLPRGAARTQEMRPSALRPTDLLSPFPSLPGSPSCPLMVEGVPCPPWSPYPALLSFHFLSKPSQVLLRRTFRGEGALPEWGRQGWSRRQMWETV